MLPVKKIFFKFLTFFFYTQWKKVYVKSNSRVKNSILNSKLDFLSRVYLSRFVRDKITQNSFKSSETAPFVKDHLKNQQPSQTLIMVSEVSAIIFRTLHWDIGN